MILLSGFAEGQLKVMAQAPFALNLLKPIDPWDLARAIRAILGLR